MKLEILVRLLLVDLSPSVETSEIKPRALVHRSTSVVRQIAVPNALLIKTVLARSRA